MAEHRGWLRAVWRGAPLLALVTAWHLFACVDGSDGIELELESQPRVVAWIDADGLGWALQSLVVRGLEVTPLACPTGLTPRRSSRRHRAHPFAARLGSALRGARPHGVARAHVLDATLFLPHVELAVSQRIAVPASPASYCDVRFELGVGGEVELILRDAHGGLRSLRAAMPWRAHARLHDASGAPTAVVVEDADDRPRLVWRSLDERLLDGVSVTAFDDAASGARLVGNLFASFDVARRPGPPNRDRAMTSGR